MKLLVALFMSLLAASVFADDAKPNRIERGAQKVEKGVKRTAERTGNAIERGAKATERGVNRTAERTGNWAERTADRTEKKVKKILE